MLLEIYGMDFKASEYPCNRRSINSFHTEKQANCLDAQFALFVSLYVSLNDFHTRLDCLNTKVV